MLPVNAQHTTPIPVLSVIVPFYNTAPYIEQCAVSLFEQTLDDMQFIFVDDGSTDNTSDILESVMERYPRRRQQTTLLKMECNQGIPSARKEGLKLVQGTFVAHCDSDDYLEPDMYNTLYQTAIQENADMVLCDFFQGIENGIRQRSHTPSPSDDYVREFLHGRLYAYLWCGISRTEMYRQVIFPTASYLEDWVQMVQLFHQCEKLVVVHRPLYHYCYHKTSVSHKTNVYNYMRQMKECMENYTLMHDYLKTHCHVDEEEFIEKKVQVRGKLLPILEKWGSGRWRKLYLNTFPEVNHRILFNPSFPRERKTEYLAVVMGLYPLMAWLRRWFRRLT